VALELTADYLAYKPAQGHLRGLRPGPAHPQPGLHRARTAQAARCFQVSPITVVAAQQRPVGYKSSAFIMSSSVLIHQEAPGRPQAAL
jgi:hypothetical protein